MHHRSIQLICNAFWYGLLKNEFYYTFSIHSNTLTHHYIYRLKTDHRRVFSSTGNNLNIHRWYGKLCMIYRKFTATSKYTEAHARTRAHTCNRSVDLIRPVMIGKQACNNWIYYKKELALSLAFAHTLSSSSSSSSPSSSPPPCVLKHFH